MKINLSFLFFLLGISGCALTETGLRITEDYNNLKNLENERRKTETSIIIINSQLENYPTDRVLQGRRDSIKVKLADLEGRIDEKRRFFNQGLKEWEDKLVRDRIQKEMELKEQNETPELNPAEQNFR